MKCLNGSSIIGSGQNWHNVKIDGMCTSNVDKQEQTASLVTWNSRYIFQVILFYLIYLILSN